MGLPAGVTTRALSFGAYTDARGQAQYVGLTGVITPSTSMLHPATGHVITATPIPFSIGSDGSALIEGLVHADDPNLVSLTRSALLYTVTWNGYSVGGGNPGTKTFPLLQAEPGNVTDYDTIAAPPESDSPALPFPSSVYERKIARTGATAGYVPTLQADGTLKLSAPTGGGGTGGIVSVNGQLPDSEGEVIVTFADFAGQIAAGQLPAGVVRTADLTTAVNTRVATAAVGTASGVASLDANGKVPQSQMPAVALQDFLGAVGSQAAMLALVGQRGDWCTRTDRGTDFQLIAEPSTALSSWRERTYPQSPVSSVAERVGAVVLSSEDLTDVTPAGRSLLQSPDAAAVRALLSTAPVLVLTTGAPVPDGTPAGTIIFRS